MTCEEFLYSTTSSVLATLITAGSFYVYQLWRYHTKLYNKYNKAIFKVYFKDIQGHEFVRVRCHVKKNVIKYSSLPQVGQTANEIFDGEFIMNEINLRIGEGYQKHRNYDGFNFPKIIIKDENTFLVETSYVKMIEQEGGTFGKSRFQAFIWRKE